MIRRILDFLIFPILFPLVFPLGIGVGGIAGITYMHHYNREMRECRTYEYQMIEEWVKENPLLVSEVKKYSSDGKFLAWEYRKLEQRKIELSRKKRFDAVIEAANKSEAEHGDREQLPFLEMD